MASRPEWWEWDLEFTPHLLKRMTDRQFDEVDLRTMMGSAHGVSPDLLPDRWRIESRHNGRPWTIIVEPLMEARLLLVITAFPA